MQKVYDGLVRYIKVWVCFSGFFFNVEKHWLNTLKIEKIWFLREIKDFVLFFLDLIFNTV